MLEVELEVEVGVGVAVGVIVPVGVGVLVGVGVADVGVAVGTIQVELLTVVLLNVIAAVWATALPSRVAPPPGKVIEAEAITVPTKEVVPLKVADESTFQNTLQG